MTSTPTQPKPVRVIAVLPTWCVGGQVVIVGESYELPPHEAARLVAAGKAKNAQTEASFGAVSR